MVVGAEPSGQQARQGVDQVEVVALDDLQPVVGVVAVGHHLGKGRLVELRVVKADGAGVHRRGGQAGHGGHHGAGIDPPGQERTQRHVGNQAQLHRFAGLKQQLAARQLTQVTPATITDHEVLVTDILESRRRGYFVTRGENVPDVWAVSAFLNVQSETLAVAIAGPRHRMENNVVECAQLLLATCSFISRQWARN